MSARSIFCGLFVLFSNVFIARLAGPLSPGLTNALVLLCLTGFILTLLASVARAKRWFSEILPLFKMARS